MKIGRRMPDPLEDESLALALDCASAPRAFSELCPLLGIATRLENLWITRSGNTI